MASPGEHHGATGAGFDPESSGSIVLEEDYDPAYEPTPEEIEQYARYIGLYYVRSRPHNAVITVLLRQRSARPHRAR